MQIAANLNPVIMPIAKNQVLIVIIHSNDGAVRKGRACISVAIV